VTRLFIDTSNQLQHYLQLKRLMMAGLTQRELSKSSPIVIEECLANGKGDTVICRYARGRLLGKVRFGMVSKQGGFASCYEFQNMATDKVSAAKIIHKSTLADHRKKQKVLFSLPS
jgi:hypothetical protein